MPQAHDALGKPFSVGDEVSIPCIVTSIGPSTQEGVPILGLTAKYNSPNNTPLTIATAYSTQTIIDK